MKILFYNHTGQISGAERVLLIILAGGDRRRFVPAVLCPADGPLMNKVRELGVRTITIDSLEARFTLRLDRLDLAVGAAPGGAQQLQVREVSALVRHDGVEREHRVLLRRLVRALEPRFPPLAARRGVGEIVAGVAARLAVERVADEREIERPAARIDDLAGRHVQKVSVEIDRLAVDVIEPPFGAADDVRDADGDLVRAGRDHVAVHPRAQAWDGRRGARRSRQRPGSGPAGSGGRTAAGCRRTRPDSRPRWQATSLRLLRPSCQNQHRLGAIGSSDGSRRDPAGLPK